METSGHKRTHGDTSGFIWTQVVTSGHMWTKVETSGHTWTQLDTHVHKYTLGNTSGVVGGDCVTAVVGILKCSEPKLPPDETMRLWRLARR